MRQSRGILTLRDGTVLSLPRLVPSFTSKGFLFFRPGNSKTGKQYSEVGKILEAVGPFLSGSILVSAYDLHHRHFRKPERFYRDKELVFIDSGGYELREDYDSTEPMHYPYKPKKFTEYHYRKVLKRLPSNLSFTVVNFDHDATLRRSSPILTQIRSAQKLFNAFPHFTRNFLIKPTRRGEPLNIDDVKPHIEKLRAFNMVGVTEKEIGDNLIDKLKLIANLRVEMNRQDIRIPIHIYGGLDPVSTPLYFFAGADIFDGASWLRYAYHKGVAVYRDSVSVLKYGVDASADRVRVFVLYDNVNYLHELTTRLRKFSDAKRLSFNMFEEQASVFKKAFEDLLVVIPCLKEIYDGR
jgi:hypothetical protein